MTNRHILHNENHYELSYELLYLLKWLMEHESATFKKIIAGAVNKGYMHTLSTATPEAQEDIQHSIVNFLEMFDVLLHESFNEYSIKKAQQINLIPAINKIDSYVCDKDTVQGSLDKTTQLAQHHPDINAKELLFKEILRRWKPGGKKHHFN